MTRVKVTAKKSTIEGIVPRYNLAVQAARRISDRSVPNDTYNKRAILYSSPDQIEETDTTESFELGSEKTDSVEFTMSASSREGSLSNSDEVDIICSVGLTISVYIYFTSTAFATHSLRRRSRRQNNAKDNLYRYLYLLP